MPRIQDTYFNLQGGLSYKTFLRHFENQAKGAANLTLLRGINSLKGDSRFRKPSVNNNLILVDLASGENTNNQNEKQPAVKVVDPTEAARLRAVDSLATEARSTLGDKGPRSDSQRHSKTGKRGRRAPSRRKTTTTTTANKAVKRARDIFED